MTVTDTAGKQKVTCVICLEEFDWNGREAYRRDDNGPPSHVTLPPRTSARWAPEIQGAVLRCPNEINRVPHYFPVDFVLHERPIVIGFVGASRAGKTCLLAAMSGEIDRQRLGPRGLRTMPVNLTEHNTYRSNVVDPFFEKGIAPPHTRNAALVSYADAVLLTTGAGLTFPLVFFDAAGEQLLGLQKHAMALRFLHRVDGLIFVVDPTKIGGEDSRDGVEDDELSDATTLDDPTYSATVAGLRFRDKKDGRLLIPAALAITKSDRLRFTPPVDRWLSRPVPSAVDRFLFRQESQDAYAFLHQRRATAWLAPVDQFQWCTLHFVSASGSSAVRSGPAGPGEEAPPGRFVRPARPRRVLEPLVALLAMIGERDVQYVRGG
ncbi:Double-GTPase 2 domain-containing protein [Frankia sp. AiPs1]|uniref:hypothetical protein n=1 Tax=Frankia sp. AiPa1 TaxID=573492 RepID=UPI00202B081D|nr:hypothetical protein [Frankia sp. AiPa1]MCL9760499.1 hypothetical protein [Frankia sp. AiPa1]